MSSGRIEERWSVLVVRVDKGEESAATVVTPAGNEKGTASEGRRRYR